MVTYIYALIDPITNNIKYIGKSNSPETRIRVHIHNAKFNKVSNVHLCRWINLLLNQGLEPELKIIEETTFEIWREREIYWIDFYQNKFKLCNKHEGGLEPPNMIGFKWSEENMKNHVSNKTRGKPQWVDRPHPLLGKPHPARGQTRSGETKQKIKEARLRTNGMKGVKLSPERKDSIRKQFSKSVNLIDENGEVVETFSSGLEAEKKFNLTKGSVCRVCKGEYKHTKGLVFRYYEE